MVAVQYGGRELSVPVIDRGPFANHASWDLTMATAGLLGVRATSTVGRSRRHRPRPSRRGTRIPLLGHANGIAVLE